MDKSGEKQGFRFVDGPMVLGDICAGWSPAGWSRELRRKAACCAELNPQASANYTAWADDIDHRLEKNKKST